MRVVAGAVLGVLVVSLAACGGSQKEAEEPTSASEEGASKESASSESKPSDTDDAKPASKPSDGAASKEKEKEAPSKTAKDIITKPDVLYVFSYPDSEPHQVAEKGCKESAKDDPKKMAECMSKAAKKIDQDSYAFQEDGEGKLWWLTIHRKGDTLVTLHKVEFEVGDASADKVTIKPHGPDKGSKPMGAVPRELVIEVPTDSEIALADPKLGRLVYTAKLGQLSKPER